MPVTTGWSIEAAERIAADIMAAAQPSEAGLVWEAHEAVRGSYPPRAKRQPIGWNLYRGTSGIALFLTELGRLTGRGDLIDAARGALGHAVAAQARDAERERRHRAGFHSGAAGLVFAVATYLRVRDDAGLRREAQRIVPGLGVPRDDLRVNDLIGGAAGSIIGLLLVRPVLGADLIDPVVEDLGDHLIRVARVEPEGLSWEGGGVRAANLCGLAHGASGIAWPLLEVHAATGRDVFRLAAEEGFAYEDRWYDEHEANWADLRNSELSRLQSQNRLREIESKLEQGEPLPFYRFRYMSAWCHGAPGIGAARARAFEVLGKPRYREQALQAAATTDALPSPALGNHSICHGELGNLLCQHEVARRTGESDRERFLVRRAEAMAQEVRGGSRWVPGGLERLAPDPTLMTGVAGIGLGLLSLEADVVSAVLPVLPAPPAVQAVSDAAPLRERIATALFPRCRAALGPDRWAGVWRSVHAASDLGPVGRTVARLVGDAVQEAGPHAVAAHRRELLELSARARAFDRSLPVLLGALPPRTGPDREVALSPWIEVHDETEVPFLVLISGEGGASLRPLSGGAGALLGLLRSPRAMAQACSAFAGEFGLAAEDVESWAEQQIDEFTRAAVVIDGWLFRALRDEGLDGCLNRRTTRHDTTHGGSSVRGSGRAGSSTVGTSSRSRRIPEKESAS